MHPSILPAAGLKNRSGAGTKSSGLPSLISFGWYFLVVAGRGCLSFPALCSLSRRGLSAALSCWVSDGGDTTVHWPQRDRGVPWGKGTTAGAACPWVPLMGGLYLMQGGPVCPCLLPVQTEWGPLYNVVLPASLILFAVLLTGCHSQHKHRNFWQKGIISV